MPQSTGSQRDGHDSVNEQQQMDKQKDKGNDSGTCVTKQTGRQRRDGTILLINGSRHYITSDKNIRWV